MYSQSVSLYLRFRGKSLLSENYFSVVPNAVLFHTLILLSAVTKNLSEAEHSATQQQEMQ